jgi:hypothetical protein
MTTDLLKGMIDKHGIEAEGRQVLECQVTLQNGNVFAGPLRLEGETCVMRAAMRNDRDVVQVDAYFAPVDVSTVMLPVKQHVVVPNGAGRLVV